MEVEESGIDVVSTLSKFSILTLNFVFTCNFVRIRVEQRTIALKRVSELEPRLLAYIDASTVFINYPRITALENDTNANSCL